MKNDKTYEVNFDNGHTNKYYTLSMARANVKYNEYNAKVVSIVSTHLDKHGNEKRKYLTF